MIDWNKPIETIDGREAKFVKEMMTGCIVYVLQQSGRRGDVFLVSDKGCRRDDRASDSEREEPIIRNVRVKREGWVVKFKGKDCLWDFQIYPSEEIAVMHVPSGTVHEVVPIKWEE